MKISRLLAIACGVAFTVIAHTQCAATATTAENKSTPQPSSVTQPAATTPATPQPSTAQPEKTGVTQMEIIKQNAKKSLEMLQKMDYPELYTKYLDLSTKEVIDFDTMISRLKGIQVVYVAESHTSTAHHKLQLDILKRLYQDNPKTALAMEFLYRSNQQVIDDYMNGKISAQEFDGTAKGGFGVWYNKYYIDIIRFAAANHIKAVGMNVEKQIKAKLADQGWDKLTPEEKKLIAKDIDTSNEDHRKFVMKQFQGMMNAMGSNKNDNWWDRMYLMQCMWDETFGESIANYLKSVNDKDVQVMVIAGSGHINYKFNTPDRSYKRYQVPFKTIVPKETNKFNPVDFSDLMFSTVGDFIYFSDMPRED